MLKAVIFDLDDTLISERQYIESGYRHIANLLSSRINLDSKEIYKVMFCLFNQDPKNVFNRLLDKFSITYTNDLIKDLVDEYRNHFPELVFYDDVLPCIEKLKENNIRTGIITDGYVCSQKQKLKSVGAYDIFDEVIITDELGREYWKPHPKAFEIIREKMDLEFSEMIYVGDNPEKDFYISKVHPIKTARICREGIYNDREYYNNIQENYRLKSLLDIIDLIND